MAGTNQYDLIFTCEQSEHRYVVLVYGRPMRLTAGSYQLLLDLLNFHHDGNYVCIPHRTYAQAIHRLRKCIDKAIQEEGAGHRFIETGVGPGYRLNPSLKIALSSRCVKLAGPTMSELFQRLADHHPVLESVTWKEL